MSYEVFIGERKSLVFPVMCHGHLRIDYSDEVAGQNYGIFGHDESVTIQTILTPYDINGFGYELSQHNPIGKMGVLTSKKTPPALQSLAFSIRDSGGSTTDTFDADNHNRRKSESGTYFGYNTAQDYQKDSTIQLKVKDKKNKASNDFAITIGSGASAFFEFYFKVENLKLLPGDYKVQVSSKGISYFQHKNLDVSYFIALEPESTYNS